MAFERVFFGELFHWLGLDETLVELGTAHFGQIKEENAAVEAGEPVRRWIADPCAWMVSPILPQQVSIDWLSVTGDSDHIALGELVKELVELTNVLLELEICVEQNHSVDSGVEHFEESNREKEERISVVRRWAVREVALHFGDQFVHFLGKHVGVDRNDLGTMHKIVR